MSASRVSTLGSGGWFLLLIVSILFSLTMAVYSTWIRFDTQDVAYSIYRMQQEAAAAKMHISKLEIERDSLLSPYMLGKTAEKLGMSMADPGQIRRLDIYKK
ncbi:MAG: hypothetical protein J6I40_00345 [Mailhella sp.]|nr:hypothetical protein [Mailhella sp.]